MHAALSGSILAFVLCSAGSLYARSPELVRDIVTSHEVRSSSPNTIFSYGERVYFFAQDANGRELWTSDGTAAGTQLLKDTAPGPAGTSWFQTAGRPVMFGSGRYVYVWLSHGGRFSLWRTDGTPTGTLSLTQHLADTDPYWPSAGMLSGVPFGENGAMLIGAVGIYITDGSPSGTKLVSRMSGSNPVRAGEYVYFTSEAMLWRTDGTAEGTVAVETLQDTRGIEKTIAVGDDVYLIAKRRSSGGMIDLYRLPARATDVEQMTTFSTWYVPQFVVTGSALWAVVNRWPVTEIWGIGSTAVRTTVIASELDFAPVIATGSHFFFWTRGNPSRLWRSDGSAAGTRQIALDAPTSIMGATAGRLYLYDDEGIWTFTPADQSTERLGVKSPLSLNTVMNGYFAAIGERVFLPLAADGQGEELWTSEGTAWTTRLVKNIAHDNNSWGSNAQRFGRSILFSANDGINGVEPWITDGSLSGTRLLANIAFGSRASSPSRFTDLGNGRALFWAFDEAQGTELRVTDGTAAGTTLLRDLGPRDTSDPAKEEPLIVLNGKALTFTDFGEIWTTDGTAEGTTLLAAVQYDKNVRPVRAGGLAYFATDEALWRTDGTPGGTFPLGVRAHDLEPDGERLFFVGYEAAHGAELWVTDGSKSGTRLVRDIRPGFGSAFNPNLQRLWLQSADGIVIAGVDDGVHGFEPWRSDGTEAGTFLLRDVVPGSRSSLLRESRSEMTAAVGGFAYFIADDRIHGAELWRSDGTTEGTTLVRDIAPDAASSYPMHLRTIGSDIYFSADDARHGRELWRTNLAATELVSDVAPGTTSSFPRNMIRVGPWLYFFATTEETGDELWRVALPTKPRAVRK